MVKIVRRTTLAAVSIGALLLTSSRAEEPANQAQEHAAEMERGKSHEEAREATPKKKTSGDKTNRRAKKHLEEMNKGKSHEEAREASDKGSADKAATRAKQHAEEMNKGKSHEQAREATDAK